MRHRRSHQSKGGQIMNTEQERAALAKESSND